MSSPLPGGEPLDLGKLIGTVLRRKWTLVFAALPVILLAFVGSMFFDPVFRATAKISLDEGTQPGGLLGDLFAISNAPPAIKEIEFLRSRTIAGKVADLPKPPPAGTVADPPDFGLGLSLVVDDWDRYWPFPSFLRGLGHGPPTAGRLHARLLELPAATPAAPLRLRFLSATEFEYGFASLLGGGDRRLTFTPGEPLELQGLRLVLTPSGDLSGRSFLLRWATLRQATEGLLANLAASETQRGSSVIKVTFSDRDPDRSARVVNQVLQAYIEHNRARLALRARTTVSYIEEQIERIKGDLDAAERELVEFQQESQAALLTETAAALVERMSELDLERAQLELLVGSQDRLAELLEGADADVLNVIGGADLDPLTASLIESLAGLLAQRAMLEPEVTPEWPALQELEARIADLRRRIHANVLARGVALREKDRTLAGAIDRYQRELDKLPATERDLARFQRRARSFEQIYTYLLDQEQEAKIAENAAIAAVSVVDWAEPPLSRLSPNLTQNLLLATALGLFLGIGLALYREAVTRKVLTASQLEAATGLPSFGVIPDFRRGAARARGKKGKWFLALRDAPRSAPAEAYRALRANLRFAAKGRDLKTLAITSTAQGEGKSVTSLDLAVALANGGARVLLIDADLRRPVIHHYFQLAVSPGTSEVLKGATPWREAVRPTKVENLSVIPAGALPERPGDLMASVGMAELVKEARADYDLVLFDVPPVLAVADASGFLHELDGIFLLCRANRIPEGLVAGAANRLRMTGAELIGSILNGVRPSRLGGDYSYGYGYGYGYGYKSGYGYGYGSSQRERERDSAPDA